MTKHVLCYLFIVSLIKVGTIMAGHRHIHTTPVRLSAIHLALTRDANNPAGCCGL